MSYPLGGDPPAYEYKFCLRNLPRPSFTAVFPNGHLGPTRADAREEETLVWLQDYFHLDIDLVNLYDKWSEQDPVFCNVRVRFSGIRMLRQDPWENLVS